MDEKGHFRTGRSFIDIVMTHPLVSDIMRPIEPSPQIAEKSESGVQITLIAPP